MWLDEVLLDVNLPQVPSSVLSSGYLNNLKGSKVYVQNILALVFTLGGLIVCVERECSYKCVCTTCNQLPRQHPNSYLNYGNERREIVRREE